MNEAPGWRKRQLSCFAGCTVIGLLILFGLVLLRGATVM